MRLKDELKLKGGIDNLDHEAILNVVITTTMLFNFSDRFFARYGVTSTQYNIIKTLEGFDEEGISQQELSQKLVVSKSNVVGLIDRLEKAGYVARQSHPTDRRQYVLHLSPKAKKLIKDVDPPYFKKVEELMANMPKAKKQSLIGALETVRDNVRSSQSSAKEIEL